jgi:hypothetical protein
MTVSRKLRGLNIENEGRVQNKKKSEQCVKGEKRIQRASASTFVGPPLANFLRYLASIAVSSMSRSRGAATRTSAQSVAWKTRYLSSNGAYLPIDGHLMLRTHTSDTHFHTFILIHTQRVPETHFHTHSHTN